MKISTTIIAVFVVCLAVSCERSSLRFPIPARCTTGVPAPGEKILPTNKAITPAGTQIRVGYHPQGMALSPGGDLLLVNENGMFKNGVRILDTANKNIKGFQPLKNISYGVGFSPDGRMAYVSGGGDNVLYRYSITGQNMASSGLLSLPGFAGGLTVSPTGTVFVAHLEENSVSAIDPMSWTIARTFTFSDGVGEFPWALEVAPGGDTLLVLNRGSGTVSLIPLIGSAEPTIIPLGEPDLLPEIHPNAVVCDPTGLRCYNANANTDMVSVIDMKTKMISRVFSLAPYTDAPYGSIPGALALSPDGKTLYTALSGENAVAVVDTSSGLITGKIPTGWYPSALAINPDGKRLYIANMKGEGQGPHWPPTPPPTNTVWEVRGTISFVDIPDDDALTSGIRQIQRNNCVQALTDSEQFTDAFTHIRHIVYIFRENKTFDEIFGDLSPLGSPFPALYSYFYGPRSVTPNIHALADRYTLSPNFYSDGEVSVQGHPLAVGGVLTDWIERLWPIAYGSEIARVPLHIMSYDNRIEAYPIQRFIFDRIVQAGLTFSNFGEFLSADKPELQAYNVDVGGFTDVTRAQRFLDALSYFELQKAMPPFIFIALPKDHCPPCYLAMNDFATAMVVDGLSHSSFWKDSVVFITEDDPQPGWDHVDTYRMFAVLAGPYVKRGYMSPRRYSFPSILKTIELIMGFPPFSQNDANALALTDCFTTEPDFTPYTALPVPMDYWPTSVLQIKAAADQWCREQQGLIEFPHPLCLKHKFPLSGTDDD